MADPMYGTAVDARMLLVRTEPQTGLRVLPFENSAHAHVLVALPASWPALTVEEAAEVRPYFTWTDTQAFWYRTQQPAVVSLERVVGGVWAAHLIEPGLILPVSDEPTHVPRGYKHLFRVLQTPGAHVGERAAPVIHQRESCPVEILRSEATHTVEAHFPAFGNDIVWLRRFLPGEETASRRNALTVEVATLRQLSARQPDSVVEVLHSSILDTAAYQGPYLAVRKPFCAPLPSFLSRLTSSDDHARTAADLGRGIARLAAGVLADNNCLGPLTPSLLGVRRGLVGRRVGEKVRLLGAPGAGPVGRKYDTDIAALLPNDGASGTHLQVDRREKRSANRDFATVGGLFELVLDACNVLDGKLRELSQALNAGKIGNIDALLRRIPDN